MVKIALIIEPDALKIICVCSAYIYTENLYYQLLPFLPLPILTSISPKNILSAVRGHWISEKLDKEKEKKNGRILGFRGICIGIVE